MKSTPQLKRTLETSLRELQGMVNVSHSRTLDDSEMRAISRKQIEVEDIVKELKSRGIDVSKMLYKKYDVGGVIQAYSSPQMAGNLTGGGWSGTLYELGGIVQSYVSPALLQFSKGGKISNQYKGKSGEEVWNMLSKEQRSHFLHDHASDIEVYRGNEELLREEIIKAYNSDWVNLDYNIKNRFANHVREGQYAEGGSTKKQNMKKPVEVSDVKGRMVEMYSEGQSTPTYHLITEVHMSDPKFSVQDLFFKVDNYDFDERIEESKIKDFLSGKQVVVYNPSSRQYYAWKLKAKAKRVYAEGGMPKVMTEDKSVKYDINKYQGILDDFDMDGLPNADDPNPNQTGDVKTVEQVEFSKVFNQILDTKENLNAELDMFVGKLQRSAPSNSVIYARTKTPYSILNKLVSSRLLDEKRGLKDLVGTTIAFDDVKDLVAYATKVRKGMYGKVLDFDDYYTNPNDGYRAYHFIVEQNKIPIELQLKTQRMKEVNTLSHDAYKKKILNKDYMLYLTSLADQADRGNSEAQQEFSRIMKNKAAVEQKLKNN